MPFNEKLANRIREALVDAGEVEEKKMFRGICFMVNGKMCVCVSGDEMMCRIGPEKFEEALEKNGVRAMIRLNKPVKNFVFISEDVLNTKKEFDHWINLCLKFNKEAKASKPKRKK